MGDVVSYMLENANGPKLTLDQQGGLTGVVKYMVENLVGNPEEIAGLALFHAGIPSMLHGYPLPSGSTDLPPVLINKESLCIDTDKCMVTCNFGRPSLALQLPPSETAPPQIENNSSLVAKKSNFDVNGRLMVISMIVEDQQQMTSTVITQIAESEILVPVLERTFTRREPHSSLAKAAAFNGRINSNTTQGDPKHTWLMKNISDRSMGDGSYLVKYHAVRNLSFLNGIYIVAPDPTAGQNRIIGWDEAVPLKDVKSGRPRPDVKLGNGIEIFQHYPEADFSLLALE